MPLPELSAIHDTYLSLSRIAHERYAGSLGGKLLLRSSFDPDGVATVLSASLTGAASLCVDADADRLRQGLRAGLCDFVVSHLDEALRILKNELRRSLPVSVGLTADPEHTLDAMIERGLAPDLLSALPETQGRTFLEWGAIALSEAARPDPSTSLVEWSVAADPARSMPRIARLASGSLDPTRDATPARQRWLAQAPRYLGRAFGQRQCLRMTGEELASFLALVHAEIPAAAITRDGQKP
jgi:hypothetical protein